MTHCLQSIRSDSRLYSAATLARVTIVYSQLPRSSTGQQRTRSGWRNSDMR
jgi:hypothetical protein